MVGYRRGMAKKRDENEPEIVQALKRVGAGVIQLSGSAGLPDLLVHFQGRTILMEVKQDGTPRVKTNHRQGRDGLDPDQFDFFAAWRGGPLVVVKTVDEALAALREEV